MASYGNIYRYIFDSQNKWTVEIVIAKKNYTGQLYTRPLGQAPVLRRDNSAGIHGTSLEIHAQCNVPGEYAQMYTSAADEYKVSLYRSGQHIWTGFLTPELYSEPDRPVPFDVHMVATDGLGELKRAKFVSSGAKTIREHLQQILDHTGISRNINIVSALFYDAGSYSALPHRILDVSIDLEHEDGETCYDVLQHLLTSFHMGITLQNDLWLLFRETDYIRLATPEGVSAYSGDNIVQLPVASFGSSNEHKWWPIGNMSATVEPARKSIEVTSPFHYTENMLKEDWTLGGRTTYDSEEKAYILPDSQSYISQQLDFGDEPVSYRLVLKVLALNVGTVEEAQNIGIRVKIDGVSYSGAGLYWLVSISSDRYGRSVNAWRKVEGSIESELAVPGEGQNEKDAQEVEVVIPLYYKDARGFVRANDIQVEVFNPSGVNSIYIYDVSLTAYDQADGTRAEVNINNGAREEASAVDLQMTDGATVPEGGRWSMTGLPFAPEGKIIAQWYINGMEGYADYLTTMAQDYAREIGAARLRYSGVLNVPYGEPLPVLFLRDGTYYWPRTYSYDLYNDEMEVDMISVPDATVEIESTVIKK